MDQIKVGKFIAACRKKQNLTQLQLAEKLAITDRAVSKWENGKAMPDSSLMLELCDVLDITVNDLLNGEKVSSEDYTKKLEAQLLEMVKHKEFTDKSLLTLQWILYVLTAVLCLALGFVAGWFVEDFVPFTIIYIVGMIFTVALDLIASRLGHKAGYYKCKKCGHTYVPPFKTVFCAFSLDGIRNWYFRCESCKKRAWHKKVLTKDE